MFLCSHEMKQKFHFNHFFFFENQRTTRRIFNEFDFHLLRSLPDIACIIQHDVCKKKANSNPISRFSSIRALFHTNWIHAESRKSFPRQKRNYPQRIGNDVPKPCSLLAYYKVIRDEIQFNVTTSVQNDRKICCLLVLVVVCLLFPLYHLYACVFLFIQRLPIYQSFPCFYGW